MNKLSFLAAAILFGLLSSFCENKTTLDWSRMTEIRGYGNINPDEDPYSGYFLGNTGLIKEAFKKLERMYGKMPVGAARYAKVNFGTGRLITLKMVTGRSLAFKVIDRNLELPGWFEAKNDLTWEEEHEIKKLQAYRKS